MGRLKISTEELKTKAAELGITEGALRLRIYRHGLEKALTIKAKETKYKRRVYTNPETGESGDWKYWCEKLGINRRTLRDRIEKKGITAETFEEKKVHPWLTEEDELLEEIYDHPRLKYLWNLKARKNGWSMRSHESVLNRILHLKKEGRVSTNRKSYIEGENDWISARKLSTVLGVSPNVIERWLEKGLRAMKTSSGKNINRHIPRYIKIENLIDWVLGDGMEIASSSICQNAMGTYWLMEKIAIYRPKNLEKAK